MTTKAGLRGLFPFAGAAAVVLVVGAVYVASGGSSLVGDSADEPRGATVELVRVTDDTRTISVEVPREWLSETDTSPAGPGDDQRPQIDASSDWGAFVFGHESGVSLTAWPRTRFPSEQRPTLTQELGMALKIGCQVDEAPYLQPDGSAKAVVTCRKKVLGVLGNDTRVYYTAWRPGNLDHTVVLEVQVKSESLGRYSTYFDTVAGTVMFHASVGEATPSSPTRTPAATAASATISPAGTSQPPRTPVGTTTRATTAPVVSPSGSPLRGLVRITDDTGRFSVDVPSRWTARQTSPIRDASNTPAVVATTDVPAYEGRAAPGVAVTVSEHLFFLPMSEIFRSLIERTTDCRATEAPMGLRIDLGLSIPGVTSATLECPGTAAILIYIGWRVTDGGSWLVLMSVQITPDALVEYPTFFGQVDRRVIVYP